MRDRWRSALLVILVVGVCVGGLGAPAPAAAAPAGAPPLAERLRPDGSLETAGYAGSLDPTGYRVAFAEDGAPRFVPGPAGWDDRFGAPGSPFAGVEAVAVAPSGEVYIGGMFRELPGVAARGVARWDGRRWHALGAGISGGGERVTRLAVYGSLVYAVGSFTSAGAVAANQIAVWDGRAWAALGSGAGPLQVHEGWTTEGTIDAVAVGPGGEVYIGGSFQRIDDTSANNVARWDGAGWRALGDGIGNRTVEGGFSPDGWVRALAVGENGELYAGGRFSMAGSATAYAIARWNGSGWSALGGGLTGENGYDPAGDVRAIALGGGRVYAAGAFVAAGGRPAANIAAWNGSGWSALGGGLTALYGGGDPVAFALLADAGGVYAAGTFTHAGGRAIAGLARWNGQGWAGLAPALAGSVDVEVLGLARGGDGGLYAAGNFSNAGERLVFGVARWSGAAWEGLGQGVSSYSHNSAEVLAVAIDSAGRVYIGGEIGYAGGLPVGNIAMWDGARWHAMGGGVRGGLVYALAADGEDLYVGGDFTQAGGVAASRVARWDPSAGRWHALGGGVDDLVYALAIGDGYLYAGGAFNHAGGGEAEDIARWDGQAWSALPGGWRIYERLDSGAEAGTYVRALAYNDGSLYIGGHFQTLHAVGTSTIPLSNYVVVHNLARYAEAEGEWYLLGGRAYPGVTTGGRSGLETTVRALAAIGDTLFVGGDFAEAGGLAAPRLARYDLSRDRWAAVGGPGGASTPSVTALAARGGELYVGGSFSSIGDAAARSLARYRLSDGSWHALGEGLSWQGEPARVLAIAAGADGIFLGGRIDAAGGHPSVGVARWGGVPAVEVAHKVYLPLLRR